MRQFCGIFFAFSLSLDALAQTIQCYGPSEYVELEDGFYHPTNLAPFFSIESKADHIVVRMVEDGAMDQLYPYKIKSQWMRKKDEEGNLINFESFYKEDEQNLSDRFAFAPEPARTVAVSNTYNQFHVMWGEDSKIETIEINGSDVETYSFLYYYPIVDGYRVVGDRYYCPLSEIRALFQKFSQSGAVTIYQ